MMTGCCKVNDIYNLRQLLKIDKKLKGKLKVLGGKFENLHT